MDDLADAGQSLPVYALLPILLLAALLAFFLCRRTPSTAARFVIIAIGLRIALTAAHEATFKRTPLGLSYNALVTIAISVIGLLIVRRRRLFGAALPPFYIYLAAVLASGIVAGETTSTANTFTKYAYLVALMLAVEDAIRDIGFDRFMKLMVPTFAVAFVLQAASVFLHVAKASESDGSASYIGGFHHEAAFSLTLSAALLVVCLQRRIGLFAKIGLIVVCIAAIFLANYRTAIVAMMPLLGFAVLVDAPRHFVSRQRAIVGGMVAILVAVAAIGGGIAARDRFADIGVAVTQGTDLIKRPGLFTPEERHVMSGRPAIWSGYLYGWLDGTPRQKTFGRGPGSWIKYFAVYAHNTLVSALFELGVLGMIATLVLWMWMLVLALLLRAGPKAEIVMAHLCFFILNMATMPMWMIEGMIYYGLLCGVTLYFFHESHRVASRRHRPAVPSFGGPVLGT